MRHKARLAEPVLRSARQPEGMRRASILVAIAAIVFAIATAFASLAASQPASSQPPVVIEGTIVMAVEDDFEKGRATLRYFLNQSGRQFDLRLMPRQAAGLQPGMTVRITGQLMGTVLTADPSDESVVVLRSPAAAPPGPTR